MQLNVVFDRQAVDDKTKGNIKKCQKVLDAQALKDSNYYCPLDTSMLQKSGILHTVIGSGKLTWKTPYAQKLYYDEHLNISRQKNPNASRRWFEAAKSKNIKNWERLVNDEYLENDK